MASYFTAHLPSPPRLSICSHDETEIICLVTPNIQSASPDAFTPFTISKFVDEWTMDDSDTPPPWPSHSDEEHDDLLDEVDLTQEEGEVEKESPEAASSVNLESEEPARLPNLRYSNSSDLLEVLRASKGESDWVLEGLIHNGDQVILGGPPK